MKSEQHDPAPSEPLERLEVSEFWKAAMAAFLSAIEHEVDRKGTAGDKAEHSDIQSSKSIAFECLMKALEHGYDVPSWVRQSVLSSWFSYRNFENCSFADAFGFPDRIPHVHARRLDHLASFISYTVDQIQHKGTDNGKKMPLKSSRKAEGALAIAAKRLNMSVANVAKYRDRWRETCKELGIDPELKDPHHVASAEASMLSGFLHGLSNSPTKIQKK